MDHITERAAVTNAPRAHTSLLIVPSALLLAGFLALYAEGITRRLDKLLPLSATVKSAGTFFPPFNEAFPFALRALAGAIVAAVIIGLTANVKIRPSERVCRLLTIGALVLIAGGTYLVYSWLSTPHNAFPSNAYIHWVDIFYGRTRNFFYTLVKPVHILFYSYPHVLQGLTGALNVILVFFIGRQIFVQRWPPVLMSLAYSISGLMLVFANGAEDVQINITALLLPVLAYARRSPWLVGVGLWVATLGRPPFILMAIGFIAIEALLPGDERPEGARSIGERARAVLRNRFLIQNAVVFAMLFLGWQAILALFDANWFFAEGRLIRTRAFGFDAIEIDEFSISPLSGAYVLHLAWIFPAPLLLANLLTATRLRAMDRRLVKTLLFIWLFVVGSLLLNEMLVLLYFNVRYLSYLWPLVLIGAFIGLRSVIDRVGRPLAIGLAFLLTASSVATFQNAAEGKRARERLPVSHLFADRIGLRRLVADGSIATTFDRLQDRNYIAYIVRRPLNEIAIVEQGTTSGNAMIFTPSLEGYEDEVIVYRGDGVYVVGPSQQGTS